MKPYYDHAGITIYHGDCLDIIPNLPAVDLILTDPPYGKLKLFNKSGAVGNRGSNEAQAKNYGAYHNERIFEIEQFLKAIEGKSQYQIIWGGNYFTLPTRTSWLCWDKSAGADSLYSQFELAWTNLPIAAKIFRHVWQGMIRQGEHITREHPTQKPVPLMNWCISLAPNQPKLILDAFMGSGTTLRAAKDLGRMAIGIDFEEKYCEVAAKRLAQEVFDLGAK